jgi:hypothetical protein
LQRLPLWSVDSRATHHRRAALKSLVIGALIVAVAVLGYLYWDSRNNTIFKAPGIEIKKNLYAVLEWHSSFKRAMLIQRVCPTRRVLLIPAVA